MIRRSSMARLVRYIIVGLTTMGVYLAAGAVLNASGLSIRWIAPLAFGAAILFNYVMQRQWVFSDARPVSASLPKYVIMILTGFIINSVVIETVATQAPLVIAQVIAAVFVIAANALFLFLWVFAVRPGCSR